MDVLFRRKSKRVSIKFGDPEFGFVLPLAAESIEKSGLGRHLHGVGEVPLGDGVESGHHIVMGVVTQDSVLVVLSSKPRDVGGVVLTTAHPGSHYWDKVVRLMSEHGSPYATSIPGLARKMPDGTVEIYVITG